MKVIITVLMLMIFLPPAAAQEEKVIQPVLTWSGKQVGNERLKAAPEKGYAANENEWANLWRAWRASEEAVPTIDFAKNLVAFCTTRTPNTCGINLTLSDAGDLKIQTFSTLIGGDSPTFNYQFVEFSREGVKTINGRPVAGGNPTSDSPNAAAQNKKTMTNKYGLFGKIQAKTGKGAELERMLLDGTKTLEKAKGCILYLVSRKADEPDAVYVMEIWESKEDHENSLKIPAVREEIRRAMPIIEAVPKGLTLEVLGGKGLESARRD